MKILLIEPGKTARAAEMENNLTAMQKTVGGPIQALYPWEDPVALVCNDEGKNEGLQLNRMLEDYDIVEGTFFLCGIEEDHFCDLPDSLMEKYRRKFLDPERFLRTPQGILSVRVKERPEKKPRQEER